MCCSFKEHYDNLDEKDVTDSKKFWKTVKPCLSDRSVKSDKINLNENGEAIKVSIKQLRY